MLHHAKIAKDDKPKMFVQMIWQILNNASCMTKSFTFIIKKHKIQASDVINVRVSQTWNSQQENKTAKLLATTQKD